ncbi:MAG: aminoacyl-tRNA hydrolase [Flavobacteriales bacterium AspAUS03]
MGKFLIVGLGNVGTMYEKTRHNVGFWILDTLVKIHSSSFTSKRLGAIAQLNFKGKYFILLKPATYINLSGKAVYYWMHKEKISLEFLFVVTDDIHLDLGVLRIRTKGSDGGHNGLKSIQESLGTSFYTRLRFGIGNHFPKGKQIDHVLGAWMEEELSKLPQRLVKATEAVLSFGLVGLQQTMDRFNGQ